MSQTLTEIAQQLSRPKTVKKTVPEKPKEVEALKPIPKVQLIYGFNGVGKTRLSREFKQLIEPKPKDGEESNDNRVKMLYYNAFTEDLFYWNNLEDDTKQKLEIQPNKYTEWVLEEQGQDRNAITHFQRYTSDKLTPHFSPDFSAVTFSFERGNEEPTENIKISKGEESCFVWSIFYSLIEQVIDVLNVAEPNERETDQFDRLEYIFIDDPVSSLDDNHLIRLAVDLAETIKLCNSKIRFIITTHNPLFFNILCNEFASDSKMLIDGRWITWKGKWFEKYRLEKSEDGTHQIIEQPNDSPFSYHLHLMRMLQDAIETGQIEKYHFSFLRNIFEKTATFLGHKRWESLLPQTDSGNPNPYLKRILNLSSHSKHSAEEIPDPDLQDKAMLRFLLTHLIDNYGFEQQGVQNG